MNDITRGLVRSSNDQHTKGWNDALDAVRKRIAAIEPTSLSYKTYSHASGYRDLALKLADAGGREYELRLAPKDVQSVIYACAEAVRQIGDHPPIDWNLYPSTIYWPAVIPWKAGERASMPNSDC